MDSRKADKIHAIYFQALGYPPGEQRWAYLNRACAEDLSLRREVEQLLARDATATVPKVESKDAVPLTRSLAGDSAHENAETRHKEMAWPGRSGWTLVGQQLGPYEVVEEIGRGGMGVVYRARDHRFGGMVALKTILHLDPTTLFRFKREFRILAGIAHPNLVTLHELVAEERCWYFTMELLQGIHFLAYVREGPDPSRNQTNRSNDTTYPTAHVVPSRRRTESVRPASLGRLDLLRPALRQLIQGVHALHRTGTLHRDLKPTNILVIPEGTVKILDFGLAAELDSKGLYQSTENQLVGTVGYMSPEQAASQPVTPASDWYSVGVILYQALTGKLPHEGTMLDILRNKQDRDPQPPNSLVADVPDDLNTLCMRLLQRSPEDRPTGEELLAFLPRDIALPPSPATAPTTPSLVGREVHLTRLKRALEEVQNGQTVTIHVHGRSGMGKSALVQQFLDHVLEQTPTEPPPVVLAGQCYEHESVPYKAADSLVDALTRYLRRLPAAEVQALMPRHFDALTRIFPALRRVGNTPARSNPATPHGGSPAIREQSDPHHFRRKAFAALRELLARIGDRSLLVLHIDDLQWGDTDSANLLIEMLKPPDPPVLMLLMSYRSEDIANSPFLRTFLPAGMGLGAMPGQSWRQDRQIVVGALSVDEASHLARICLGPRAEAIDPDTLEHIAKESEGSPFYVYELVRSLQTERQATEVSLTDVLWARIGQLADDARRLLEVVTVAGQPVLQEVAFEAAGLFRDPHATLKLLRSERFLRGQTTQTHFALGTYHDQVRETVLAHLSAEALRAWHGRLAEAMDGIQQIDQERLARHWEGAGQLQRASELYSEAASRATQSLAFDHAAALYRRALVLGNHDPETVRRLRRECGDALMHARRGVEAAQEYLKVAEDAPRSQSLRFRQLAAEQLLLSGHVDEGLEVLESVLRTLRLGSVSRSRWRVQGSILWQTLLLCCARWHAPPRIERECSEEELVRQDTLHTLAMAFGHVSLNLSKDYALGGLRLALRLREPGRLARSLSWAAVGHSLTGGTTWRTRWFLQRARTEVERANTPAAHIWWTVSSGLVALIEGKWRQSRELMAEADQRLRAGGAAMPREVHHLASYYEFLALFFMGEAGEIKRRLPTALEDAEMRGDLWAVTHMLGLLSFLRCIEDAPDLAREELHQVTARWSPHWAEHHRRNAIIGYLHIALYEGDGQEAWKWIQEHGQSLTRSSTMRVQLMRIWFLLLRAGAALMAARTDPGSANQVLYRQAERDLRTIDREDAPWAHAWGRLYHAALAARTDLKATLRLITEAETMLRAADMSLLAACAQRWRGLLLGDTEGQRMVEESDSWMRAQGIQNPLRVACGWCPGIRDQM